MWVYGGMWGERAHMSISFGLASSHNAALSLLSSNLEMIFGSCIHVSAGHVKKKQSKPPCFVFLFHTPINIKTLTHSGYRSRGWVTWWFQQTIGSSFPFLPLTINTHTAANNAAKSNPVINYHCWYRSTDTEVHKLHFFPPYLVLCKHCTHLPHTYTLHAHKTVILLTALITPARAAEWYGPWFTYKWIPSDGLQEALILHSEHFELMATAHHSLVRSTLRIFCHDGDC